MIFFLPRTHRTTKWLMALPGLFLLVGCHTEKPGVVLYSDMEASVAGPLAKDFERQKGIPVRVVYASPKDMQSGVGLSERLREESASPMADVYWARELVALEKLHREGVLESYKDVGTGRIDAHFKEAKGEWYGLAGHVRVLLYNTRLVTPAHVPKSVASLTQPTWKERGAMADPRTNGSARYHVATLFAVLGAAEATHLLEAMKANDVQFLPDETAVVEAVSSGKAAWGVVNSDVAGAAMDAKKPVNYVIADQEPYATGNALGRGQGTVPTAGTPLSCSTASLIHNAPHFNEGRSLLEYLLSLRAAGKLSELQSHAIPTNIDMLQGQKSSPPPHRIDLDKLQLPPVQGEQVTAMEPQVTLALDSVFGASAH